jgi:hypothetical protein
MVRTVGKKDYMLMYRGEAGCTMRYEPVCYCCCYLLYTYAIPLERIVFTNAQYVFSCIVVCTFPSHAQEIYPSHKNKNKKYTLLTNNNTLPNTYYGIIHAYF